MADKPHRDSVTGRYARRPVPDVDATSAFDPVGDSAEDIDNVSGANWPGARMYPHHRPRGDDLAQGGQSSPLRPRTQRLVSQAGRDVLEQHAKPDRSTLHADAMREAAGPDAGDLDPVRYLTGCIEGSE